MSQLGKIFLYVALVGALFAVGFGVLVINQRSSDTITLAQTQQAVKTEAQLNKKVQADADAATQAKNEADTELTEQKSKVDDLNSKLADEQKQQSDLEAAVQTSKDATAKAQAALDHVNSVLAGVSPEDMKANVDKLTAQVQADAAEQKILQDQLQAAVKQVEDLKLAINNKATGTMPPGVSGKVTFVNRTWNFVVLNVGLSNGVVPNGELIVYRGRNFLGKIKVTSAEDTTAVADILPDAKADIQVGDDVLN
jgi:hypothetical protein